MALALLQFVCFQAALFAAATALVGRRPAALLLVLAVELTLESSLAALFSFTHANSPVAYWIAALVCAVAAAASGRLRLPTIKVAPLVAALLAPLALLAFHPVDEIDSINYLHYLIEWMANRATPYDFATYYVAFWELSFLPTWVVTKLDVFFPLLALKALAIFALAAWYLGRELRLKGALLTATVFGACVLPHLWNNPSGVATLKNDTLHGAGFLLLTLVAVRAARRRLAPSDFLLLTAGIVFAPVKYLGIFFVPVALAVVLWYRWRQFRWPAVLGASLTFLVTTCHYYVHHLVKWGSPFYPVQINLGPIHLPGTADLSNTSILYNIRNPEVWRIFFLPEGGVSPGGLMFPLVLALTLILCVALLFRRSHRVLALLLLAGWLLYFRSALGAGGAPGDLHFIRNGLNTLRYAEGVLAASELLLAALFVRIAPALVGANAASRLYLLYRQIPAQLFPLPVVIAVAAGMLLLLLAIRRPKLRAPVCLLALLLGCPLLVERNRVLWTPYWNDMKPALAAVRDQGLTVLALPDGGYFAGHIVAAGNPVNPAVRCLLPEDLDSPRYLAILFSPGSEGAATWRKSYPGYTPIKEGQYGQLLKRTR
ncbi:MAG TPA: hypothetical protein VG456_17275 [Candidatus Sulfopaludibacter sp.]|jgi:hypothetical protein|nr:hypothetical protein [Candidatus Sulfopaludibacter sp.]